MDYYVSSMRFYWHTQNDLVIELCYEFLENNVALHYHILQERCSRQLIACEGIKMLSSVISVCCATFYENGTIIRTFLNKSHFKRGNNRLY